MHPQSTTRPLPLRISETDSRQQRVKRYQPGMIVPVSTFPGEEKLGKWSNQFSYYLGRVEKVIGENNEQRLQCRLLLDPKIQKPGDNNEGHEQLPEQGKRLWKDTWYVDIPRRGRNIKIRKTISRANRDQGFEPWIFEVGIDAIIPIADVISVSSVGKLKAPIAKLLDVIVAGQQKPTERKEVRRSTRRRTERNYRQMLRGNS